MSKATSFLGRPEPMMPVAEHEALLDHANLLAITDAQTGLLRKEVWNEQLEKRISEVPQLGSNFGVVYMDLDGTKRGNTALGHEDIDDFLGSMTKTLVSGLRRRDEASSRMAHETLFVNPQQIEGGRTGGDEFALLVDNIVAEDLDHETRDSNVDHYRRNTKLLPDERLELVVEKLRTLIDKFLATQSDDIRKLLNISIGGAVYRPGMSPADLRRAADHKMMENKLERKKKELSLPRRAAKKIGRPLMLYAGVDKRLI